VLARGKNAIGLQQYVVVYGKARITEGGAPVLLQRLAHIYLGPNVEFPRDRRPLFGRHGFARVADEAD
jgi:hypothetical protein